MAPNLKLKAVSMALTNVRLTNKLNRMEWVFYTEDNEYAFLIKAHNSDSAYQLAYENYGPQVESMRYQLLKYAPDNIKQKLTNKTK